MYSFYYYFRSCWSQITVCTSGLYPLKNNDEIFNVRTFLEHHMWTHCALWLVGKTPVDSTPIDHAKITWAYWRYRRLLIKQEQKYWYHLDNLQLAPCTLKVSKGNWTSLLSTFILYGEAIFTTLWEELDSFTWLNWTWHYMHSTLSRYVAYCLQSVRQWLIDCWPHIIRGRINPRRCTCFVFHITEHTLSIPHWNRQSKCEAKDKAISNTFHCTTNG